MEKDAQFLTMMLQNIVNNPEKVRVEKKVDEMGVLLIVDVDQEDIGKIIGKKGVVIRAMCTLLKVYGLNNNKIINVKINNLKPHEGQ